MPKFYIIETFEYSEFSTLEDAIREAQEIGANGFIVKAVAEVEWKQAQPVFTTTKLED